MKTILPTAAVLLGIVLLLLSAVWGKLFPPTNTWTDEKSVQLTELGSEVRRLGFSLAEAQSTGKNASELQAAHDKVRSEYDQLHEEFNSAKKSPQLVATVLRWAGIGLVAVAGMVVMISRGSS